MNHRTNPSLLGLLCLVACTSRPSTDPTDTAEDSAATTQATTSDGTTGHPGASSSGGVGTSAALTSSGVADSSEDSSPFVFDLWIPDLPPPVDFSCNGCDPSAEYCCEMPAFFHGPPPKWPPEEVCVALPRACEADPSCECVVAEVPGASLDACMVSRVGVVEIGPCGVVEGEKDASE